MSHPKDPNNGSKPFGASGLPDGLSFNSSTGIISGTIHDLGPVCPTVILCDGLPLPPPDPVVQRLHDPDTMRWLAEITTSDDDLRVQPAARSNH
jgi:hypothetical protein